MNVKLPEDITVFSAKEVDEEFHPRYSVKNKTYKYVIDNGEYRDPFQNGKAWHLGKPLDESKMNRAAKAVVGKYDFSAFMASGSSVSDATRTVTKAEVTRNGNNVIFTVTADGFLYNMVRIMMGTLVDVAYGKIKEEEIGDIIDSKDRSIAGMTAPPDGLFLFEVLY